MGLAKPKVVSLTEIKRELGYTISFYVNTRTLRIKKNK